MSVALTGASGFIGRAVSTRLIRAGHTVRAVSTRTPPAPEALAGCNAVIHLAGEPIAQRWTRAVRERIRLSRVEGTRALVAAMRPHPPRVLISASGVGYYGSRGDDVLPESEPPGRDFLAEICLAWEREAEAAESLGTRVARLRIGMVVGPAGGAVNKMLLPFKLGLGARLGSGRQWMSWIHLDDLVSMIEFLLRESTLRGAFNAVSPHPVTNAEFTRALAAAVGRPAVLAAPAFALKLLLGEMSQVLLDSQRAVPEAIVRAGFTFDYPDVYGALAEAVK